MEAVGEERLEHGGALGVGEVLSARDGGGVEFGFEVELVAVDRGRAAGYELRVDDAVGVADEFEERDIGGGVAVGCGRQTPEAGGCGGFDGCDIEG